MKSIINTGLFLIMLLFLCNCTPKELVSVYKLNKFKGNYRKNVLIGIDSSVTKEIGSKEYFPIYLNFDYQNHPWGYVRSISDSVFFTWGNNCGERLLFINNFEARGKSYQLIGDWNYIGGEPFSPKMEFTLSSMEEQKKVGKVYKYSIVYLHPLGSDYMALESISFSPKKGIVSVIFVTPDGRRQEIKP